MANLYRVDSPINREQRNNLNSTFDDILRRFTNLQRQINILAGDEEVDVLLQRITDAINNAETTTADLEVLINLMEPKLVEIQTAIDNANGAADDANVLNIALTALKGELEVLQFDLNGIVQAETQRETNELERIENEDERVLAEGERITNENERKANEQGRVNAESQRVSTFDAQMLTANQKIAMMQYLIDNLASYDYEADATFNFPNLIKWNGSTFIALQEVTGVTPIDDGINYRLVAQRGVDGTGAVSSVNGMGPDANGNVEVIMALVNNLVSDSTTAGLTAAQGKALKVMFDALQQAFSSHAGAVDNPHQVTAEQVALGDVQNFGVATQVEAETGTASDKYMTPQSTKQAIDKNLVTISETIEQVETELTTHLDDLVTDADGAHGLKIEYGTWTPTINRSGVVYNRRVGRYKRIGNVVFISAELSFTNVGTSSVGTVVEGLPFARTNNTLQLINAIATGLATPQGVMGRISTHTGIDLVNLPGDAFIAASQLQNTTVITITGSYDI